MLSGTKSALNLYGKALAFVIFWNTFHLLLVFCAELVKCYASPEEIPFNVTATNQ